MLKQKISDFIKSVVDEKVAVLEKRREYFVNEAKDSEQDDVAKEIDEMVNDISRHELLHEMALDVESGKRPKVDL